jgi:hypothetical protein
MKLATDPYTDNWYMFDTMRGMSTTNDLRLDANNAAAETSMNQAYLVPNATGFASGYNGWTPGGDYIYIAIRRGPMKVPTTGASVFAPLVINAATGTSYTTGFPVDSQWTQNRNASATHVIDRLRYASTTASDGGSILSPAGTNSESVTASARNWGSTGGQIPSNYASQDRIFWNFRRAPGFFDEICFSGTGANKTEAHNLQKAPELWLVKSRSATTQWVFGSSLLGANEKIVMPSPNGRVTDTTVWNNTYPTSSVLSLGTSSTTNASGATFVGYLMATAAGVSKVGTYTGNGSSQTIDCGFAGGARFVMIIRATASTAQDIYVWDSARGIVAGNDPRLSLNTTAAEVTTLDTVDAASTGFIVNTDASNVNVNGAVYLYWSIA